MKNVTLSLMLLLIPASAAHAFNVEYVCTDKQDGHRYVVRLKNDAQTKTHRGDGCYSFDAPGLCGDGSLRDWSGDHGSGCDGHDDWRVAPTRNR